MAGDGALFRWADAARAAVAQLIGEGLLLEEAVDDHEVLKHHASGASLVDDWLTKRRKPPPDTVATLKAIATEWVVRERCRLRRLRRNDAGR